MEESMKKQQALVERLSELGLNESNLILGPEDLRMYTSRIIIARNGDIEAAVQQIQEHQSFLKKFNMDTFYRLKGQDVLECDMETINEIYPLYIKGFDRFGHSCVFAKIGAMDMKTVLKYTTAEKFINYHTWLRERMFRMRDFMITEDPVFKIDDADATHSQYTVIMDFANTKLSQASSTLYDVMKQTTHIDQIYYPERVYRIIAINVPWLFNVVWKVVKNFLDKDTIAKFRFCTSNYTAELGSIVSPEELPEDYGGMLPAISNEDHISYVTERYFVHRDRIHESHIDVPHSVKADTVESPPRLEIPEAFASPKAQIPPLRIRIDSEHKLERQLSLIEQLHPHTPRGSKQNGQIDIADLKRQLIDAYLRFERTEHMTLVENQRLRSLIFRLQNEKRPGYDNPKIANLDQRIRKLEEQLRGVMEETGAHERALKFARNYLEKVNQDPVENEENTRALRATIRALKREKAVLAAAVEEHFGKGSANLILQPREVVINNNSK